MSVMQGHLAVHRILRMTILVYAPLVRILRYAITLPRYILPRTKLKNVLRANLGRRQNVPTSRPKEMEGECVATLTAHTATKRARLKANTRLFSNLGNILRLHLPDQDINLERWSMAAKMYL